MDLMISPCYKCTERQLGCHSSCEKYKSWTIEREKIKNLQIQELNEFKSTKDYADMVKKRRH